MGNTSWWVVDWAIEAYGIEWWFNIQCSVMVLRTYIPTLITEYITPYPYCTRLSSPLLTSTLLYSATSPLFYARFLLHLRQSRPVAHLVEFWFGLI